ncbi:hypothetical protein D3C72_2516670 [compost metagenome]
MTWPEVLTTDATSPSRLVNDCAKLANCSGLTETTMTPSKLPARRMGRVNWIDHLRETLPFTGSLMNSMSRPPAF